MRCSGARDGGLAIRLRKAPARAPAQARAHRANVEREDARLVVAAVAVRVGALHLPVLALPQLALVGAAVHNILRRAHKDGLRARAAASQVRRVASRRRRASGCARTHGARCCCARGWWRCWRAPSCPCPPTECPRPGCPACTAEGRARRAGGVRAAGTTQRGAVQKAAHLVHCDVGGAQLTADV